jgi:hypothetical protein
LANHRFANWFATLLRPTISPPWPPSPAAKTLTAPIWDVYFGDIATGSIGKCAGVPLHVDQWKWGCGLQAPSGRRLSAAGTAASFEQAREAFGEAWAKIEPQLTPENLDAERHERARTAWEIRHARSRTPAADAVDARPIEMILRTRDRYRRRGWPRRHRYLEMQ